jgi:protein TonB
MTADGFLAQKQRHPLAMTAAVAINVAAVTALLLAKTGWVPPIETILIGENIPLPPDPKPVEVDKAPETPVKKEPVYIPPQPVPTANGNDNAISGTDVLPPVRTAGGTDAGTGATSIPTPTPTPVPVLTGAAPDPRFADDFQPSYPPQLMRTGVEGITVVKVLIGTDGRVKQVAIVSTDDPLFADATERQALRRWRFLPATRDGIAVESWKKMTVRFELRG